MADQDSKSTAPQQTLQKPNSSDLRPPASSSPTDKALSQASGVRQPTENPEATQNARALNPEPAHDLVANQPQQVLGQASPNVPLTEEERREAYEMGLDAAGFRQWQQSPRGQQK